MSLSQGIRNTIVNNRGKLGALAGVGLAATIPKVYSDNEALINQAGYNAIVKGNNIIAPVTGAPVIDPRISDVVNNHYSKVQEDPTDIFGRERPIPNSIEAFKTSNFLQGVKDKFTGSEVTENTYPRGPLLIPIKQLILEGYTYDEIQESILNKLAAGVAVAGLVGGIVPAVKTHLKTPNNLNSEYSIGNKNQYESKGSEKLKQIGVVAPAKQLEKGQLTNYFNNKK